MRRSFTEEMTSLAAMGNVTEVHAPRTGFSDRVGEFMPTSERGKCLDLKLLGKFDPRHFSLQVAS